MGKKLCFLGILCLFLIPQQLFAQMSSPNLAPKKETTLLNAESSKVRQSYLKTISNKSELDYVAKRISYHKLLSYPFFVLATPIVFPAYYSYTKEPNLHNSFKGYWRWIDYKVPCELSEIANSKITFPNPRLRKEGEYVYERTIIPREKTVEREQLDPVYESINVKEKEIKSKKVKAYSKIKKKRIKTKVVVPDKTIEVERQKQDDIDAKLQSKVEYYKVKANKAKSAKKYKKALKYYNKILKLNLADEDVLAEIDVIGKLLEKEKLVKLNKKKSKSIKKVESVDNLDKSQKNSLKKTIIKTKKSKKTSISRSIKNFEKAEGYFNAKKYDRAVVYYKKVLSINPSNQLAQRRLRTIEYIKKFEKEKTPSIKKSESVIKSNIPHKKISRLMQKANRAYSKNKFSKAITICLKVLRLDISNQDAKKLINTMNEEIRAAKMDTTLSALESNDSK